MPRIFCPAPASPPWTPGLTLELPAGAARHVQVLRMQPGQALTLFNGLGGQWLAHISAMGRSSVAVQLQAHDPVEHEAALAVHLALGIPANERMDWLVEKATELGAASIQPLTTERSVLRLGGERAEKKRAHWQAIAQAACEQCGRNRVPALAPVQTLGSWLDALGTDPLAVRWLLAPGAPALAPHAAALAGSSGLGATLLSGPEGGLSPAEQTQALGQGFVALGLGPRVLRAETAPLAALAVLALR